MTTETLQTVLTTMIQAHETLTEIGREKSDVIKAGEMAALQSIINREDVSLRILQQLEGQRQKAVDAWAHQHIKTATPGDYRLLDIIETAPAGEADRLAALQDRLNRAISDLREVNSLNQQLLHQSLQWVQMSMNLLQPQTPQATYGNPKKAQAKPPVQSRIDSKA